MHEAYCRVIDLIDAGTINHRAVSMALAKMRPDVFLTIHDAVDGAGASEELQLDHELLDIMARGNLVEAIKHHRTVTGMGLKESKDYCDALKARGVPNSVPSTAKASMNTLKSLLDDLLGQEPASAVKTTDKGEFR
jgi:ribosomal protein L7/L12